MEKTVKIKEGKVSMRELGAFLQVKKPYGDWVSELVYRHRLAEDLDYTKVKKGFMQADHLVPVEIAEEIVSEMTCDKAKDLKDQFINVQTKKEQKMDAKNYVACAEKIIKEKNKQEVFEEGSCSNFLFEGHKVRVKINEKGETWFVAKDVAAALDISWSGQTLSRIPDKWKLMIKFITSFGAKPTTFINEMAVYKLAFRSSKEEADRFSNWIASEVLPSISRTGSYHINPGENIDIDRVKDMAKKGAIQALYASDIAVTTANRAEKKADDINIRIDRLGLDGDTGYRSVVGYQRQNNYSLPRGAHQQIGKVASRLSRERDIEIDSAPCPRWGKVNTYSVDILKEVFTDWFKFTHKHCLV